MSSDTNKLDAIYDLRKAAEEKGRAEHALEVAPSPEALDSLREARTEVERKTIEAIHACHECGHDHAPGSSHGKRPSTAS